MPREQDVVPDHLQIAGAPHLPERQPHLQRAEAPRILRAVVEVVHDLIVEVVVGRVIREGAAQLVGIAHEHAAGFERRVEPLVGIDRDRIGVAQRAQARRRSRRLRRQRTVGAVHVKPQLVLAADGGDLRERIDGARADRAGGADDEKRLMAEPEILLDPAAQGGRVHPLLVVGGDPADGVGAEAEQVGGLLDPRVGFRRRVDQQRAVLRATAPPFARPTEPWPRGRRGSRRSWPCCRR